MLSACILSLALGALAPSAPSAPAPPDAAARKKAAAAVLALAKELAGVSAFEAARAELRRAIRLDPETATKTLGEIARLAGKPDKVAAGVDVAARVKKSHDACGAELAKVADAASRADRSLDAARVATLLHVEFADSAAAAASTAKWFAPWALFVEQKDVLRLEAGGEFVDGKWLAPDSVKAQDAKHADWDDPWVVSDGVHEVRTTQPLRVASAILHRAAAYREMFTGEFAGEWDLAPPAGLLPIIVAKTRTEMEERMRAFSGESLPPSLGAAFYAKTERANGPVFVTFETVDVNGRHVVLTLDQLWFLFQHELGHQIAWEYGCRGQPKGRPPEHQFWCVEGLANLMAFHELGADGVWRLTNPRRQPLGDSAFSDCPGAWCQGHPDEIPKLAEFFARDQAAITNIPSYMVATTLARFLLVGADRKYRKSAIDLFRAVHSPGKKDGLFEKCFPGVKVDALDAEFRAFVREMQIDP